MKKIINNFKNILFNNYANFKGRADRSEMWLFQAILYLVCMIIYTCMYPFIIMFTFMFGLMTGDGMHNESAVILMLIIYGVFFVIMLPFIIPSLAVVVRRLHDTNRSGWYLLLNLIPILGGIILTVLLAIDGNRGTNRYGDDPKIKLYTRQI